jgi:hypothetical protein
MEKQASKTRLFSVELKSKAQLKSIMVTNGGSPEGVMIEGVLGELERACFAEGIILEVVGSCGVLRVDLAEQEITKPLLKNEKETK